MANYRLKLSDGTVTVDFYGTDSYVLEDGLRLPPPRQDNSFISSPLFHGDRLAASRFGNRAITLNIKIVGTSRADLKTNIRSIQRLLTDARERYLLGYGSKVYLEYQWGDAAGESIYFDILTGSLELPPDFYNQMLTEKFTVVGAQLSLECKPFGRYTNQTIAQATLENEQSGGNLNYMDITTAEAYGDLPAKMYLRINPIAEATDRKLWVARRSGTRQTDNLWKQGEDELSTLAIYIANPPIASNVFSDQADAACSGGNYIRERITTALNVATIPADTILGQFNYSYDPPPRGSFRVLACVKVYSSHDVADYSKMQFGLLYSYGAVSYSPSYANGDYIIPPEHNAWRVIDLGLVNIPPTNESEIASSNIMGITIYAYTHEGLHADAGAQYTYDWDIDWILLLPADEGICIIDNMAADTVLALDTISDPGGVLRLSNTYVIMGPYSAVGAPFNLGRENTRIYVVRDDIPARTFAVDITYQPQFLLV